MILIADSGSTKTEWVLLSDGKVVANFFTQGLNPYFQNENEIERVLTGELLPQIKVLIPGLGFRIFYYGAGCSSDETCAMVRRPLQKVFPESKVNVEHDLLGAARALCGKEKGIAAILGTGSNSCLFDGLHIIANNPSLGFILGDEGSGGHIGKELLKMFVYGELNDNLKKDFSKTFNLDKGKILDHIYHQPMPNRFCASFMPFVAEHYELEQVKELVRNSFHEFFKRHITKYEGYQTLPFSCVGSVALIFRDQLHEVSKVFGVNMRRVIKNPMEGLISYHSETA